MRIKSNLHFYVTLAAGKLILGKGIKKFEAGNIHQVCCVGKKSNAPAPGRSPAPNSSTT